MKVSFNLFVKVKILLPSWI